MQDPENKKINILISDMNPNVRKLLYREMKEEKYEILMAANACELVNNLKKKKIDLLILDPELIDDSGETISEIINPKDQEIFIILHAFPDTANLKPALNKSVLIEKDGNSIERIKHYLKDLLNRHNY